MYIKCFKKNNYKKKTLQCYYDVLSSSNELVYQLGRQRVSECSPSCSPGFRKPVWDMKPILCFDYVNAQWGRFPARLINVWIENVFFFYTATETECAKSCLLLDSPILNVKTLT